MINSQINDFHIGKTYMPNGGLTPDCVHCKQYQGRPYNQEEPFCTLHMINLALPIRVFCSRYIDPEPQEIDWLDHELDRSQLQDHMMYVWLEGDEDEFFHVPFVSIDEYKNWTLEKAFEELGKISDQY